MINFDKFSSTVELAEAIQNEIPNVDINNGDRTWGEIAERLEKWAANPKQTVINSKKMQDAAKLLRAAEARWFELEG